MSVAVDSAAPAPAAASTRATLHGPSLRVRAFQAGVLIVLAMLAFRTQLAQITLLALEDAEAAHLLVAPLIIGLMLHRRRVALREALGRHSLWGLALIVIGLGILIASSWPFNYGYPQRIAIVPVVTGVVWLVGGWRFLWRCLPMVLVLLLAIPISSRYYAFLIIKPETLTLDLTQQVLGLLPGVEVTLDGLDLTFERGAAAGAIALGEPHRGAALLMAGLMIGVFVTFYEFRPVWQVILFGVLAVPIVLVCNALRLWLWGGLAIYGGFGPTSPVPRLVTGAVALVLCYVAFATLACAFRPAVPSPPPSSEHPLTNTNTNERVADEPA